MNTMKIAAIDIGSNSVRLMMWADGKTLYKRINTTRLGEGLVSTGVMSPAAMHRTAAAVRDFAAAAAEEGAAKVYAFATAAVRRAANREEFLGEVRRVAGIEVDVISGEEEAEIGILGALGNSDGGMIDVGGASTEIIVRRGGKSVYAHSADVGAVRLYDACGRDYDKLNGFITAALAEYGEVPVCGAMYAIGGTATTMAAVALALEKYDPAVIDGTRIGVAQAGEMAQKLLSMPVDEVMKMSGMDPRRADIIGGGSLLMYRIMRMLGLSEITVSERDNLEGYVALREGL